MEPLDSKLSNKGNFGLKYKSTFLNELTKVNLFKRKDKPTRLRNRGYYDMYTILLKRREDAINKQAEVYLRNASDFLEKESQRQMTERQKEQYNEIMGHFNRGLFSYLTDKIKNYERDQQLKKQLENDEYLLEDERELNKTLKLIDTLDDRRDKNAQAIMRLRNKIDEMRLQSIDDEMTEKIDNLQNKLAEITAQEMADETVSNIISELDEDERIENAIEVENEREAEQQQQLEEVEEQTEELTAEQSKRNDLLNERNELIKQRDALIDPINKNIDKFKKATKLKTKLEALSELNLISEEKQNNIMRILNKSQKEIFNDNLERNILLDAQRLADFNQEKTDLELTELITRIPKRSYAGRPTSETLQRDIVILRQEIERYRGGL